MYAAILAASALLAVPFQPGTAVANSDHASGKRCWQDIRAIDDQADTDVRDVDKLITLLEDEVGDRAIASGDPGLQERLHAKIAAAKTRRADILDKQHDDLNEIRARCDRLRDEQERAADPDGLSKSRR